MVPSPSHPKLLEIRHLRVEIEGASCAFPVVDGVSMDVAHGRVVALVGESGCGKSMTALSILRLLPRPAARITSGRILWNQGTKARRHEGTKEREKEGVAQVQPYRTWSHDARGAGVSPRPGRSKLETIGADSLDLLTISEREMRSMRGRKIAMVFQEPMTALNPVFSVGEQIAEVLILHQKMSKKEAWTAAADLLDQVGIERPAARLKEYPHQFSGGMRQRVLIAMALACGPQLLIADEPTTALDVTVQAQILGLLREIQARTRMSILLITHDLGVVAQFAQYVYVMYAGRVVEHAPAAEILTRPLHPYTAGLLRCTPRLDDCAALTPIPGSVPDPAAWPTGCRFHPRCELTRTRATDALQASTLLAEQATVLRRCVEQYEGQPSGVPALREITDDHYVACWEA